MVLCLDLYFRVESDEYPVGPGKHFSNLFRCSLAVIFNGPPFQPSYNLHLQVGLKNTNFTEDGKLIQ